jgi:hypothetical protein
MQSPRGPRARVDPSGELGDVTQHLGLWRGGQGVAATTAFWRCSAAGVARHPDEYLTEIADLFLDELSRSQRGVYRRLGERMGVDQSTARSRVMSAMRRGLPVWTGSDYEPAAHRPGEDPWDPTGSFENMFGLLERWVAKHRLHEADLERRSPCYRSITPS